MGWRSIEIALLSMRCSGTSVSLDLLEKITLGLASVSSKPPPSLADQRCLQKISSYVTPFRLKEGFALLL